MHCKICSGASREIFEETLLGKHKIKYYHCSNCHFIQTETPYWLDEAYSSAICAQDTGIMQRNIELAKKVPLILFYLFDKNKKFLDYAGGYGIFTRMMRDLGFDFYWEDKFCKNNLAMRFEDNNSRYEVITSFESFEHFVDPIAEILNLLKKSDNILFTTELLPENKIPNQDWWYFSFSSGQHISFYSQKTLKIIAEKFGLKFYTNGFLHLLSKNDLSLKTKDCFIAHHLLKQEVISLANKAFGKKKKFSESGIFYKILKIKKDRNKEIERNLGSKTYSDHLFLSKKDYA